MVGSTPANVIGAALSPGLAGVPDRDSASKFAAIGRCRVEATVAGFNTRDNVYLLVRQ